MRAATALTILLFAAACAKEPAPQAAASTSPSAAPSESAPTGFTIGALQDADMNVQGCQTGLSRIGDPAPAPTLFFAEAADQPPAKGFIRIDGELVTVTLTSSSRDEASSTGIRTLENADHTVKVVETLKAGAANEASDSVEQSGTLAVTARGATQTIPVEGGTAC
jgi:hypothetical protein